MDELLVSPTTPPPVQQEEAPTSSTELRSDSPKADAPSSPQGDSVTLSPQSIQKDQEESKANPNEVDEVDEVDEADEADEDGFDALAAKINTHLEPHNRKISFEVDSESNELQALIIDLETNEVVKSIPPDDVLDMKEKISEMIGLIIDEEF